MKSVHLFRPHHFLQLVEPGCITAAGQIAEAEMKGARIRASGITHVEGSRQSLGHLDLQTVDGPCKADITRPVDL
jgi:hypothetical protein